MQLSFSEAEGKALWLAKLAKQKKNYVGRYSSSNSKRWASPSKRFKVADELLEPGRNASELLEAYPIQSKRRQKVSFSQQITIKNQKATIWKECRILKKLESEVRVLQEIQQREVEEAEKRRQERCDVVWESLRHINGISFADVVAAEKEMFDRIMQDKRMRLQPYRGSPKSEFKIGHCEVPMEISRCHRFVKDNLYFVIDEINKFWQAVGNRGSDLRWYFTYDGIKKEDTPMWYDLVDAAKREKIHMFTIHFEFVKWKREKKEESKKQQQQNESKSADSRLAKPGTDCV